MSMFSRLAYIAIRKETTENTPLKPNVFFGATKVDILTKYGAVAASPIMADRTLNINPVQNAIGAPAGTVSLQIEPKNIGHFLTAVFGAVSTGVFFPVSGVSGTFSVGETITGGTSTKTAVVVAVSAEKDYLLVSTLSGAFTIGETLTGGTSSATGVLGTYDSTVNGHEFKGPQTSLPTYTVEVGLLNEAYRFTGVKFPSFKSVSDKGNIVTADVEVMGRAQFLHGRVTAIVNSSGSPVTIPIDQTQGLISADSIKIFRPSTGAFIDLNGSGVKTHTISSLVAETSITIPSLTTTLAVGDLVILAPQTPSYSQARELSWIGGSVAAVADSMTAALTADAASIETFDLGIQNEVEERHAANAANLNGRFPTLLGLKAWKGTGKLQRAYPDETFMDRLRNSTPSALLVKHTGDLIGATAIKYRLDWRCPKLVFAAYNPAIDTDALLNEVVPFDFYKDTTSGYSAKALLVSDASSF